MSDLYREPDGYQDPVDDRPRKWVKRKPDPSIETSWSWEHIGIKPPSGKVVKQIRSQSPSNTPKHGSVSPVVRKKVAELAPSQSPTSSSQKASNVDRSTITESEKYIARRLILDLDINELYSACSDPSGVKFQAFSAPLIQRLSEFIRGETINPKHILALLRKTLKITIP